MNKIHTFLFLTIGLLLLSMFNPFLLKGQSKVKKPNVLLIFTDDHRYTGVHALGNMAVKTPSMDRLAENGIVFRQAYLQGAFVGATCIASRAMLQTGRSLFKLKAAGWSLPDEHATIGEAFQNAGYHSHIVGKWHQDKASLSRSFSSGSTVMGLGVYLVDHFRMPLWDWDESGTFAKEDAYLLTYNNEHKIVRRAVAETDERGPTGTENDGPHTSEVFADNAVSFIKDYKQNDPFFIYLAFHAPHDPRQAPQAYRDMYPVNDIELPPSYMPQHPFDNGHLYLRDEALASWPRTIEVAQQHLADYYAIITHLDAQIGRVIEALKASGQYENTIIVLSGDSGLSVGNHGLMGKQNVYDEDGIHVPLIISGGLVGDKGTSRDAFCYIHDIFPTICDLASVQKPASVNGKSLVPVIENKTVTVRDYTYHAYRQHQRAYRKGNYKLIEYVKAPDYSKKHGEFLSGSRVTQLFNVKTDPWETTDLSFLPQYKAVLDSMRIEMKQKAIELEDWKESVEMKYDFWDYFN